jgi:hypothetical protein
MTTFNNSASASNFAPTTSLAIVLADKNTNIVRSNVNRVVEDTQVTGNPVVKLVYKVARYLPKGKRNGKPQLAMLERVNKFGDVTAMTYLHFEDQYLSGLVMARVFADGTHSLSREEDLEAKDGLKFDVNISFTANQLASLKKQIEAEATKLTKVPKNEMGLSLLRGYQLQVELYHDECRVDNKPDSDDTIVYYITSDAVKSVKLVNQNEHPQEFLNFSSGVQASYSVMLSAYSAPKKVERHATPQNSAEALQLIRALSRSANRNKARANKDLAKKTFTLDLDTEKIKPSSPTPEVDDDTCLI